MIITISQPAGFFQGVLRVTDAYDRTSKDIIATEYARNTHRLHECPEHILRMGLLSTVDVLELKAQLLLGGHATNSRI